MKVYIATRLSRAPDHNRLRDLLKAEGVELTYDWTTHGSVKETSVEVLRDVAQSELRGVLDADVVVVLLPGGHGTHVELGAALGAGKRVVVHSQNPELFEACKETCAFYHHPDIERVQGSFEELATVVCAGVVVDDLVGSHDPPGRGDGGRDDPSVHHLSRLRAWLFL